MRLLWIKKWNLFERLSNLCTFILWIYWFENIYLHTKNRFCFAFCACSPDKWILDVVGPGILNVALAWVCILLGTMEFDVLWWVMVVNSISVDEFLINKTNFWFCIPYQLLDAIKGNNITFCEKTIVLNKRWFFVKWEKSINKGFLVLGRKRKKKTNSLIKQMKF